jgi:hypothetical protein
VIKRLRGQVTRGIAAVSVAVVTDFVAVGGHTRKEFRYALGLFGSVAPSGGFPRRGLIRRGDKCFQSVQAVAQCVVVLSVSIVRPRISPVVGLTERTVQAIVADLEAAGYLTRTRIGRRTRYTVNADSPFRHKAQEGLRIGPGPRPTDGDG